MSWKTPEQAREYQRKYRARKVATGLCAQCRKRPARPNRTQCTFCTQRQSGYYAAARVTAINAYGGKCVCCGVKEEVFLEIDHINNNGKSHRQAIEKKGGYDFHVWLKVNGFPAGLQVLCRNCHKAKTYRGGCPHQKGKKL